MATLRTQNLTITYKEYDTPEELDKDDRNLLEKAVEAAGNAYAPYSMFRVGAALKLESGAIVKGTNVENAAFPSGICAERSAISASASCFPGDKPVSIAIAALTSDILTDEPVTPCGNCRQVIAEEESRHGRQIKIILAGKKKIIIIEGIKNLLPLQFSKISLRLNPPLL
jgi:cytidine deaminase